MWPYYRLTRKHIWNTSCKIYLVHDLISQCIIEVYIPHSFVKIWEDIWKLNQQFILREKDRGYQNYMRYLAILTSLLGLPWWSTD